MKCTKDMYTHLIRLAPFATQCTVIVTLNPSSIVRMILPHLARELAVREKKACGSWQLFDITCAQLNLHVSVVDRNLSLDPLTPGFRSPHSHCPTEPKEEQSSNEVVAPISPPWLNYKPDSHSSTVFRCRRARRATMSMSYVSVAACKADCVGFLVTAQPCHWVTASSTQMGLRRMSRACTHQLQHLPTSTSRSETQISQRRQNW